MNWYRPKNRIDKIFETGIIIKGITGLLELVGGSILLFIGPARMHQFIVFITQREVVEDPRDKIANILLQSTARLSSDTRLFLVVYLWIHAAIKIIAVIGLLKNWLWAYPFSIISLGALMIYQAYSIVFVRLSAGMVFLTLFDACILWLIWKEFEQLKRSTNQYASKTPQ